MQQQAEAYGRDGIRISGIGRRERLPESLCEILAHAETRTRAAGRLHLRLAVDYSARDTILEAARRATDAQLHSRERFLGLLEEVAAHGPCGEVDLLIRTGGEQRLSDFLLWESAYAELIFTERFWPDFAGEDLARAVEAFRARDRRFGRIQEAS